MMKVVGASAYSPAAAAAAAVSGPMALSVDSSTTIRAQHQARTVTKLKRMMQAGVPRGAVVQQALVAGIDPALIIIVGPSSCRGRDGHQQVLADRLAEARKARAHQQQLRWKRMGKVGVPAGAIAQCVGLEQTELAKLGLLLQENKAVKEEKPPLFWFVPNKDMGDQVEFLTKTPSNNNNNKSNHVELATVVAKVVRTRAPVKENQPLIVNLLPLYQHLGTFRALAHAQTQYNTAVTDRRSLAPAEVALYRQALWEQLSQIGIRIPLDGNQCVELEGLQDFVKFLEDHFADKLHEYRRLAKEEGLYTFDSLAELYPAGTRVVAKDVVSCGVDMMCEVIWSRYEQGRTLMGDKTTFVVCFQFVVGVGGQYFTPCQFVERLESFVGPRRIASLSFGPVEFMAMNTGTTDKQQQWSLLSKFKKRGERYAKWATGSQFLQYHAGSFYPKVGKIRSSTAPTALQGRIMVDTQGSYNAGYSPSMGYDPMIASIHAKLKDFMVLKRQQETVGSTSGNVMTGDYSMVLLEQLPEDFLELTWPTVVGFSFTSKAWGDVLMDGLSEIDFQEDAFDKLVLPAARKRMIKALVRHSQDSFCDIVRGKGEGSVFLLYGPPGVGKTLTAEAISEMLHKPLYCVSLGQLGTTAAQLEAKLGEILELCARWDALILLDEADIFLEKRSSTGSLERNAMVSVMLRLVEYFSGVLFLTSNRVSALDPAFQTRITMALCYETLDVKAHEQIWTNLLQASGHVSAIENGVIDTHKLAQTELNGREIKNAIRLSMALAAEDGKPLSQEFLTETVGLLCAFNRTLKTAEAY